jgi:anthranilate synthase component II
MHILLIDNYDSFTYNLGHYLGYFTQSVRVVRNDQVRQCDLDWCDKLLISPGPGLPSQAGSVETIIRDYAGVKPILGVCLGLQAIVTTFGGSLRNLPQVLHGVALPTIILDSDDYLFKDISSPFRCGRYHSWVADVLPDSLECIAGDEQGEIMALRHKKADIRAVQFHPESVLTENGLLLIGNWVKHTQAIHKAD